MSLSVFDAGANLRRVGFRCEQGGEDRVRDAVSDKGYSKLQTLSDCIEHDITTTLSEPKFHGDRRGDNKPEPHKIAFDANHNRVISEEGKSPLRQRGEEVERTFSHLCETGGSRHMTVRGMVKA